MKKLLLFGLAISIGLSVQSQNLKTAPGVRKMPVKGGHKAIVAQKASMGADNLTPVRRTQPITVATPTHATRSSLVFTDAIVGRTIYDLQSNRGTAKRISNNGDGSLSTAWTMTPIGGTNGTDRGTGYNYFDGTAWGPLPTARIEPIRTGFTNIDYTSQAGEVVVAHTGAQGMLQTHRAIKGTGAWDTVTVGGFNILPNQADVWPRMAVGGANGTSVHVIVNSQGTGTTPVLGQNGPLTYSRSLDGGATWIDDHIQIPGTDVNFMAGVGAEEYHIDARGDVIAVVIGGFTSDVTLLKSTDNGATWTKTIIDSFPIFNYDPATMNTDIDGDGTPDTLETNAGDVTVTIDNNNMCHVAYGYMRTFEDIGATNESYFPTEDGLLYWNEMMGSNPAMMVAATQDFNLNGFTDIPTPGDTSLDTGYGHYNIGLTGQPSIGIDASNRIYMAYTSIDERADTTSYQQAHRHVFIIASNDNGVTWTYPYTINPSPDADFDEAMWPSVAKRVDGNVFVAYQRDAAPGHSLSNNVFELNNNLANPSDWVVATIPVTTLGVQQNAGSSSNLATANYPNPAHDYTTINVNLTKSSDVTIDVTNVMGQVIYSEIKSNMSVGTHSVTLNVSKLNAGVYLYTVTAGDQKVSHKMIVQ